MICHYSGREIPEGQQVMVGATIPGVKASYAVHPDEIGRHRENLIAFHESEQNCNTCKNLCRINHEKRSDGFLHGICNLSGKEIKFHPDDPMHMDCYLSRWGQ